MKLFWRISKFALLGLIIPAGVLAFGYFWLGPNMNRMPRLDDADWEQEVRTITPVTEASLEPEPAPASNPNGPVVKVVAVKADHRRKRTYKPQAVQGLEEEVRPSEATAEVPPTDGGN